MRTHELGRHAAGGFTKHFELANDSILNDPILVKLPAIRLGN